MQSLPYVVKFVFSAVVILVAVGILLLVWTPPQTVQGKKNPPQPPSVTIEQQTRGDNSPAIGGVDGDVIISIEKNGNKK